MITRSDVKASLLELPDPLRSAFRLCTIRPLRGYIRFAPWAAGKAWLYDTIAGHLWWLETRVAASTNFGSTLEIDATDIVGKHIYYFGVWEPALTGWISRRLKPGDTFVDVGANVGYYTLLASKLVGDAGTVVSIEALPEMCRTLSRNLQRNNAGNVRLVNAAAWDKSEMVPSFTRPDNLAGTTTLVHEWAERWQLSPWREVEARPLSLILQPDEIRSARLMKIDVEGAEFRVVSEMASWLGETRQDFEVVIEVSRTMLQSQQKRLEDLLEIFARFGFSGYRIQNDYRASSCIGPAIRRQPGRIQTWPDEDVEQVDLIFSRNGESI